MQWVNEFHECIAIGLFCEYTVRLDMEPRLASIEIQLLVNK